MKIPGGGAAVPILAVLTIAACRPSPTVTLDPAQWDVGTVAYGSSVSQTITITNSSGYPLQMMLFGPAPGIEVSGLPIPDLEPEGQAQLHLVLSPQFDESASIEEDVVLLIGGYSGGEWGDTSTTAKLHVVGASVPGP